MAKNSYSERITTPEFRCNFPVVFTPKEDLSHNLKYSVVMMFDKGTDMTALGNAIEDVIQRQWGDDVPEGLKKPFRDGDKSKHDCYKGCLYATASNYPDYKPQVVDANLQAILDPSQIYAGCILKASITAVTYNTAGNVGVRFLLGAVQKVGDGDPISASAVNIEDAFEPIKVAENINNRSLLG